MKWSTSLILLMSVLNVLAGCSSRDAEIASPHTISLSSTKAINLTGQLEGYATNPVVSVNDNNWWVTWLEWDPKAQKDSIQAVKFIAGKEEKRVRVDIPGGDYLHPQVLALGDGSAWFFWVAVQESTSQIFARQMLANGWAGPPVMVGHTDIAGAFPKAAAANASDDPCVTWESAATWGREISIACWTGSKFVTADSPSAAGESSYEPAITSTKNGDFWVAWHARRESNYEIFLRRFSGTQWGKPIQVTSPVDKESGRFSGMHVMPQLATSADGRLWISWISKGLRKGKANGWVVNRRVQFRAIDLEGEMSPIQQLPINPENRNMYVTEADAGPEVASFTVSNNKLHFFYRKVVSKDFSWDLQAQVSPIGSNQWLEKPVRFMPKDERKSGYPTPASVQPIGEGALIVWQADNRTVEFDPTSRTQPESDIYLQVVDEKDLAEFPITGNSPYLYTAPLSYDQERPTAAKPHLGKELKLLQGDLHSHSVGSHDGQSGNDLFRENIRRAHDNGKLQFYAMTDHGMHATTADWHMQQKIRSIYDRIGDMQLLLGFEYTNDLRDERGRVFGHQNVIFKNKRAKLRSHISYPSPLSLWSALSPGDSISIPHHSGNREHPYTLDYFDARFVRVFEISQERGSFECWCCERVSGDGKVCTSGSNSNISPADGGGYFHQALARGQQVGVVASPDHHGFDGLAGVYASSTSAEGVFNALHNRQSFGVTSYAARLTVDFRADGHLMGEAYTLSQDNCPIFYLHAMTDHIDKIRGKKSVIEALRLYRIIDTPLGEEGYISTLSPNTNEYTTTFYDDDCPRSGTAAYYLRAQQSWTEGLGTSLAWSSPIFINWNEGDKSRNAIAQSSALPMRVRPGEKFNATISMKNSGSIAWTGLEGYALQMTDESIAAFSSTSPLKLAEEEFALPGEVFTWAPEFSAPVTPGKYSINWQVTSPAGEFGDVGGASIVVSDN